MITNIIQDRKPILCKISDRILDKLQRTLHVKNAVRLFDRILVKELIKNADVSEFDVIILENMAGLALNTLIRTQKEGCQARTYFHIHNNIDMYDK